MMDAAQISSPLIQAATSELNAAIVRALSKICETAECKAAGLVLLLEEEPAILLGFAPDETISDAAVSDRSAHLLSAVSRCRADRINHGVPCALDDSTEDVLFPVTEGERVIAALALMDGKDLLNMGGALWAGVRDALRNAAMRWAADDRARRKVEAERKATARWKDAAKEQEQLVQSVFNGSPVMMHTADLDGKIVSVNEQWVRTMGYDAAEVIGTRSTDYLTDRFQEKSAAIREGLLARGMVTGVDAQGVTKAGEIIDVLVGAKLVNAPDGAPCRIVTTLLDITERKRAEAALRLRESYLSAIFENQPGLVWLKDDEGRFLAVNRKFAKFCGESEPESLVGKTDLDSWPLEIAEKYRKDDLAVMKRGQPVRVEEPIYDQGEERWFETFKMPVHNAQGEVIGTTGYAHDITARKQEEAALRNVQKLEALGILAGGIAHDFNNLLGGIFGYVDLSLGKTAEPSVLEMLSKALSTIDRARGLTRQLLTFSRGGSPIKTVEQLAPFVEETAHFALSGSRVSCHFTPAPDLWLCEVDKNQIGQVIDNIVINAQQAMPDGGTLEITADNVTVPVDVNPALLEPGRYVRLAFCDSGVGMPKEIVSRIFDPFFTTKSRGHGLGLATCHSIVHRHGGGIDVVSEPGKGSVLTVYLPATEAPVSSTAPLSSVAKSGGGNVIVMDDETVILDILGAMLTSLGYSVTAVCNGTEALDALQRMKGDGEPVAAVILDLTIPGGMGGREAAAEMRRIDPSVPLFAASGYADDPIMADPEAHGFRGSLSKPFRRLELAAMLRKGPATS